MPQPYELSRQGDVVVLHMRNGENRFNLDTVSALNAALDQVEQDPSAGALVTVGEGKFYSNGLDLDWMAGVSAEAARAHVDKVHALFGRMLAFPMITVSAMNGHTFAAGAMFALAHDYRVMRSDRGFFCLPEVDIQIPFTPPMTALIQARMSKRAAHEAMVTGKRFNAEEALALDIAHVLGTESEVLPKSVTLAQTHAKKHRATLAAIKRGAYSQALELLGFKG
jgi:Delta3-Delta2-enoyl-CoA isomerase